MLASLAADGVSGGDGGQPKKKTVRSQQQKPSSSLVPQLAQTAPSVAESALLQPKQQTKQTASPINFASKEGRWNKENIVNEMATVPEATVKISKITSSANQPTVTVNNIAAPTFAKEQPAATTPPASSNISASTSPTDAPLTSVKIKLLGHENATPTTNAANKSTLSARELFQSPMSAISTSDDDSSDDGLEDGSESSSEENVDGDQSQDDSDASINDESEEESARNNSDSASREDQGSFVIKTTLLDGISYESTGGESGSKGSNTNEREERSIINSSNNSYDEDNESIDDEASFPEQEESEDEEYSIEEENDSDGDEEFEFDDESSDSKRKRRRGHGKKKKSAETNGRNVEGDSNGSVDERTMDEGDEADIKNCSVAEVSEENSSDCESMGTDFGNDYALDEENAEEKAEVANPMECEYINGFADVKVVDKEPEESNESSVVEEKASSNRAAQLLVETTAQTAEDPTSQPPAKLVSTSPITEPSNSDLMDEVDRLFAAADKNAVTVRDIVRSVAAHFGLVKVEKGTKKLIKARLTELIRAGDEVNGERVDSVVGEEVKEAVTGSVYVEGTRDVRAECSNVVIRELESSDETDCACVDDNVANEDNTISDKQSDVQPLPSCNAGEMDVYDGCAKEECNNISIEQADGASESNQQTAITANLNVNDASVPLIATEGSGNVGSVPLEGNVELDEDCCNESFMSGTSALFKNLSPECMKSSSRNGSDEVDRLMSSMSLTDPMPASNESTRRVTKGKWNLGDKIGSGSFGVVHVGMNAVDGSKFSR